MLVSQIFRFTLEKLFNSSQKFCSSRPWGLLYLTQGYKVHCYVFWKVSCAYVYCFATKFQIFRVKLSPDLLVWKEARWPRLFWKPYFFCQQWKVSTVLFISSAKLCWLGTRLLIGKYMKYNVSTYNSGLIQRMAFCLSPCPMNEQMILACQNYPPEIKYIP